MEVNVDKNLEFCHEELYIIDDGNGITHLLSHASASGLHFARIANYEIYNKNRAFGEFAP